MREITSETFRSNGNYELIPLDRLSPMEQALIAPERDPDCYGVLKLRGQQLGSKSVCRDTALLWFTLQNPGCLPSYLRSIPIEKLNQLITALVLDEILEIEWEGQFVCGPSALPAIEAESRPFADEGHIAKISVEALRYAQCLELQDASVLSARLYFYNRLPASPEWRGRRLPTSEAVGEFLGINSGSVIRDQFENFWIAVPPRPYEAWFVWNSRSEPSQGNQSPSATYKLYISPLLADVREALKHSLRICAQRHAFSLKIGREAPGLLRPDKMVAYFKNLEDLQAAAEALESELSGCAPQGTPFTAAISSDGLLSWGIDPPQGQNSLLGDQGASWRSWITDRLAAALLLAKTSPADSVEPWQFALQRLQFEGIDTQTWMPNSLYSERVGLSRK